MINKLENTKVCMILMGGLLHDGRVRKEAMSLVNNRCKVTVVTMPKSPEHNLGLPGIGVSEIILRSRSISFGFPGLLAKYVEFTIRSAWRAARSKSYVYHAHDLPALLPAFLAARLTKGKLIYDAHELFTERNSPFSDNVGWRLLERWLLKKVDGVLTTNQSRAEIIFREYGARAYPISIYNCPVWRQPSCTQSSLREFVRTECPDVDTIVLSHGAISPGRQCEQLIASASNLQDGTVIVFLGYGSPDSYIDTLKAYAEGLGVADKVLFHPAVPNALISDYVRSADVGTVFYSNSCRNNYYCSSNKLFDFLMAGVPVVGSELPGVTEIVRSENVGLTVDSANSQEIANAINRLTSDREAYDRMSGNALTLSRRRFNWKRQEEELLAFYRDLVVQTESAV